MEWFLKVVRDNYMNFTGRARRKEFWMFVLWQFIILLPLYILTFAVFGDPLDPSMFFMVLYTLVSLALFLPGLAVSVRRLHDTGRSGWWLLISFIPFLGFIVLLVWFCMEGDNGPNEYGEDPKQVEPAY